MLQNIDKRDVVRLSLVLALLLSASTAFAQTTVFTYQGRLQDGGAPANGNYDMQFKLFDTATVGTGSQAGATITNGTVAVTSGVFTVQLDFGATAFPGADRFLEISVRPAGSLAPYTVLIPRQPITSTPYAIRALNATNAIQNSTVQQANSSFNISDNGSVGGTLAASALTAATLNISGNGTMSGTLAAGALSAATLNISGNGTVSGTLNAGNGNFVGTVSAGTVNATSVNVTGNGRVNGTLSAGALSSDSAVTASTLNLTGNAIVAGEVSAGTFNTDGDYEINGSTVISVNANNLFVGPNAGQGNTSGDFNSFFGKNAGQVNSSGEKNSFFGENAGQLNSASANSFFGFGAGDHTTGGSGNAFFGSTAGSNNSGGSNNSFFGSQAGVGVTSGSNNTAVGAGAGNTNTGSNNTMIGSGASANGSLSFATVIGAGAVVTTSNTVVLGRASDTVIVPNTLTLTTPGTGGSGSSLCLNPTNQISTCSSSLRYKTGIAPYTSGLNLINRLHPINFIWKEGGKKDFGLGAEDVEKVEPLLVTYNAKGQVEGVKYDRVAVVLLNAVKEQQTQIAQQTEQIRQQQRQIENLKKVVCLGHPRAAICK